MGTPRKLNIGILTSSRADYGIYLPLLRKLKIDGLHSVQLIAFGTHLSKKHGFTIDEILRDGFIVAHKIETTPEEDSAEAITKSMGETMEKFSLLWSKHANDFDVIFCLGDRYEMFAAVASTAPYNLKLAHLHGGETTLGAIDNAFRHSITQFSSIHFTSTEQYAERVRSMIDDKLHVYPVGALGLDHFNQQKMMTHAEIQAKFNIEVDEKTILCTFHPETISPEKNEGYAKEIIETFHQIKSHRVVITLPNADTSGNTIRSLFNEAFGHSEKVSLVENLGTAGYLSAMNACAMMFGNSSSGIIEAASLGKYVIDIGDRQKGRAHGDNVIHCEIEKQKMLAAIESIASRPQLSHNNIYYMGGATEKIIERIESVLC